jgi:hypothetical protein
LTDLELRRRILRFFADEASAPGPAEVGAEAGDFRRLAEAGALVLTEAGGIRIANPFSGVPTGYTAEADGRSWDANCAWDALGILAALGRDGTARTTCSDCGEPLALGVEGGQLVATDAVAHFLVPAARWYDDLVHT